MTTPPGKHDPRDEQREEPNYQATRREMAQRLSESYSEMMAHEDDDLSTKPNWNKAIDEAIKKVEGQK